MLSDTIHERLKGWFARILLGLIIISFALFGIDAYFKGGGGNWIASVGKQKIGVAEYDELLRKEQYSLREKGERDASVLESPELKQHVLDQLIRERVLLQAALARGYDIPDSELMGVVASNPQFQVNGQFSQALFDSYLVQQRMTRPQFFLEMKRNVVVNSMMTVPLVTSFVPKTTSEHLSKLLAEQREVSTAVISNDSFLSRAKVDSAMIESYYAAHPDGFRMPEQAKVEYLVFSPAALMASITPSEEEIKAYYESHLDEFSSPEQRELAHILIRVPADAGPAEAKALEAKAEEILKKARANPNGFGELAKQYSQDAATAARGGNLGIVVHGKMSPALEKAAFDLKPGEVAGPVQSPDGYHIVMLKSLKAGEKRPLAEVKDRVIEELKREMAQRRFNEEADKFGDLVYAQFSSLKPAADQYKLTIQTSGWIPRTGGQGVLGNERLLQALFSDEAIKQKRNTEAIEVTPGTMVAARIADYKPAGQKPLAEVRGEIEKLLQLQQASKLATQEGEARLAELRQGHSAAGLSFGPVLTVDRQDAHGLNAQEIREVFQAPAANLPYYVGVPGDKGYDILKVSKAATPAERITELSQTIPAELSKGTAFMLGAAYVDSLKAEAKIEIRKDLLEKSDR